MVIFEWISVSLLVICCSVAAATDLKKGRISNRWISFFLVLAIVADIVHYVVLDRTQISAFVVNAGSVITIALLLYCMHIWAGGDSKLLIVIGLLYPVEFYWKTSETIITLWNMIGMMFIWGFLYLFIESIVMTIKEFSGLSALFNAQELKRSVFRYAKNIIYISALTHIYLFFVSPYIALPDMVYMLVCILLIRLLERAGIFDSKFLLLAVLIFDIIMTIFTKNITISTFWLTYVISMLSIFLRTFMNRYNYLTVPTSTVQTGMILSQATTIGFQQSRVSGLPGISDESLKSRLTEQEAASVRRWETSKYGQKEIVVVRKIPFAVFMLGGLLMYIVWGIIIK